MSEEEQSRQHRRQPGRPRHEQPSETIRVPGELAPAIKQIIKAFRQTREKERPS